MKRDTWDGFITREQGDKSTGGIDRDGLIRKDDTTGFITSGTSDC